jgi:hypothetical protein
VSLTREKHLGKAIRLLDMIMDYFAKNNDDIVFTNYELICYEVNFSSLKYFLKY